MTKQTNLEPIRHSLAHLLAAAVLDLWPDAKPTIGPAIEDGFYYDFEFGKPVSNDDLPKIEKKMREILKSWDKFEEKKISKKEALEHYKTNPYKRELLEEIAAKKEDITFYTSGEFTDLCRGGHVSSAKEIKADAFKLTSVAGAYWRGDEKNKMLTRIYGAAFATKDELEAHLKMLEEAKKRDHKILGPKLELFMFHHTAPGMPYWLPKGVALLNELISFWRQEHQNDYHEIISPILNKKELYETSGHYDHYWPEMFIARGKGDKEEYGVKAMNCPNAMVVFGSKPRSVKDLPLRFSDTDPLHRYERSGVLNALFRTREFRQDDAHCFITEDQIEIEKEYNNIFKIVEKFYKIFDLEYEYRLGTRPEEFLGDKKTWDKAEKTLEKILKQSGKNYDINEGDGAFYGPKIDIIMKDAIGRTWQMGTIQLDFQQPIRFHLEYTDTDGKKRTPVVIHRVVYGSLERFVALLIEHFGGAFPLWLSPVQVAVLPISDEINEYAKQLVKDLRLKIKDLRVEIDSRTESIGKKIREAEMQKTPYMLIVGKKERDQKTVSVRQRGERDLGGMKLDKFIEKIQKEIETKSI